MSAVNTMSPGVCLTLTDGERTQLLPILQQALRDKEIEVHRTEAPTFRAYVEQQEALLRRLVEELRRA